MNIMVRQHFFQQQKKEKNENINRQKKEKTDGTDRCIHTCQNIKSKR